MTPGGHIDARNSGDSPVTPGGAPIASSLFSELLARRRASSLESGLHDQFAAQFEAPLGSTVESWLPQAKRVPAT